MKTKRFMIMFIVLICMFLSACGVIKSKFAKKQGEKMCKIINKLDAVESSSTKVSNIDGYVRLHINAELKDDCDFYDSIMKIKMITDKNENYNMYVNVTKNNIKVQWYDLYLENSKSDFNTDLVKEVLIAAEDTIESYPGKYIIIIGDKILDLISIELDDLADDNFTKQKLFDPYLLENTDRYSIVDEHLFIKCSDNKLAVLNVLSKVDSRDLEELGVPILVMNYIYNDIPNVLFQYISEKNIQNKKELSEYIKSIVKDCDDIFISIQTGLYESINFLWNSEAKVFELRDNSNSKQEISTELEPFIDLFK